MSSRLLNGLTRRIGQLSLGRPTRPMSTMVAAANTGRCTNTSSRLSIPHAVQWTMTPSVATYLSPFGEQPGGNTLAALSNPMAQFNRTFATRKKRLAKRFKRRLEQKRLAKQKEDTDAGVPSGEGEAAPQHEAWVEFQKSISVEGFQTGQTTKAKVLQKAESGQKLRDLKRREKLEMRMASKRPEISDVRGGHFPTLRYSDEETERLLAMAYAAIPERAGKRGTRNLRRQKRRWFLVRKIHAKQKRHLIQAHFKRMEERSMRMQEIKAIKAEAVDVRARDREYQMQVLRRWTQNLAEDDGDYAGRELIQAEATVVEQESKA